MKGVITLLFLLSVALSLKVRSANHEDAFPFTTWVNSNAPDQTCGCQFHFVWPRTMTDCPGCGGTLVSTAIAGGVDICNEKPDYKTQACCWPTSQSDSVLDKWWS